MNRGDIWIATESGYASKPRPMLIIQSDRYNKDDSVVTCLVTSHEMTVTDAEYRVGLPKTKENGLKIDSYVMIDKIVAVPRSRLNKRIGRLSNVKLEEVYVRLMDFLAK
jgi:mRNA interferase MazF